MMIFAVSICATRAYTQAMPIQARRVQQCVARTKLLFGAECHVILSGDASEELKAIERLYKKLMPESWQVHLIESVKTDPAAEVPHKDRDADREKEDKELSKEEREKREVEVEAKKRAAFRRIADMREEAHAKAVKLGVDFCWSLDSDVIPPTNALRTSFDTLAFDDGFYSIAFCPYPNMLFLGGLGDPGRPMSEDYLPHERKLSRRHRICLEECERRIRAGINGSGQSMGPHIRKITNEHERKARLERLARTKGPDGTIWEVIAKYGWRRRGWLDNVYPGIGIGALVPVEWCGFGCTLMKRDALAVADFSSYGGQGTEDIYVIVHGWQPAGMKIGCLPHCPADHILYEKKDGREQRIYLRSFHEPAGEYRGHLRIERRVWQEDQKRELSDTKPVPVKKDRNRLK